MRKDLNQRDKRHQQRRSAWQAFVEAAHQSAAQNGQPVKLDLSLEERKGIYWKLQNEDQCKLAQQLPQFPWEVQL